MHTTSSHPVRAAQKHIYRDYVKRPADVVGAVAGLVVLTPPMLVVAAAIWMTMGTPVLFRQLRPGKDERIFTLVKFRTMLESKRDADNNILPDVDRLTRTGRILRKTSLDELPQMINVLRGEMSFIGPRPLAVHYLDHYSPEERARHCVRPGITGLAQVVGRNSLNWEERFRYDLEYVNNVTLVNDLRILRMTVGTVFKGTNISLRGTGKVQDFDEHRRATQSSRASSERSMASDTQ